MKKIRAAFYVFLKSLVSPNYYKEIIKTDFSFSLKYYVVLALIFTFFTSIYTFIPLIPKIDQGIEDAITYTLEIYDDDLIITIEEGKLSINKEEPYVVSMPVNSTNAFENLLVYDSDGTLEDLENTYNTLILANDTNLLVQQGDSVQVYPVGNFPDGEFTEEDLRVIAVTIRDLAKFIPYVVGTVLFLAVSFYYLVFRLAYLFIIGVVLWTAGTVKGLSLKYLQYYGVAIHAMTLPLCIELLNNIFQVSLPGIPWFILLHLGFGFLVLFQPDFGSAKTEGVSEEDEV